MQALDRSRGLRLQQNAVSHALHSKHADLLLYQFRQNQLFKAAVMGVHDVQRHLSGIKLEAVFRGYFEHVQVYMRIFVSGEAYMPKLPGPACLQKRSVGSCLVEDSMWVFVANDLVMLHEIYVIDL